MPVYEAQKADGGSEWVYFDGTNKQRFATKALALAAEGEANDMAREQDFITEVRTASRAIWDAINTLKGLQTEWNALDYSNELDPGEGDNAGITAAEVGAVLFDTTNAFQTVLNAGHATNMAKLL